MLVRSTDRLVAAAVVPSLLLTWLVLVGMDALLAFASELPQLGEGDYDVPTALLYVALTVPRRAYAMFPSAALIGSLLGLGALAASNELTALRAGGISKRRICAGVTALLAGLTAAMVLCGETVGPWGEQRARTVAGTARSKDMTNTGWNDVWAREGDTFFHAVHGRADVERDTVEFDRVELYELAGNGSLRALAVAQRAEHRGGRWTLHDVTRSTFEPRRVATSHADVEDWPSQLSPELMGLTVVRPRFMAGHALHETIDYLRRNGLDAGEYESAYWARWFFPLHVLVLCMATMPFAFGMLRSGGFGKRLFVGIAIGTAYLVLQRLAIDLAAVQGVDLRIGNLLPPLAAVLASAWWFRKER